MISISKISTILTSRLETNKSRRADKGLCTSSKAVAKVGVGLKDNAVLNDIS